MTARTTVLDADVRAAMQALGAAAKKGLGDPALAELVQIRASQPNHCAFCLDLHLAIARRHGVGERQLDQLGELGATRLTFGPGQRRAMAALGGIAAHPGQPPRDGARIAPRHGVTENAPERGQT